MDIKTKRDFDDVVWFMYSNGARSGKIVSMKIHIAKNKKQFEQYTVAMEDGVEVKGIELVYDSKQELLNSL